MFRLILLKKTKTQYFQSLKVAQIVSISLIRMTFPMLNRAIFFLMNFLSHLHKSSRMSNKN